MMWTCLNCGHLVEAERSTKTFCSDKCRIAYRRRENPDYADWKNPKTRAKYMKKYGKKYYQENK